MKRSTLILASAGMILAGAAVVQVLGGPEASAAVPILDPQHLRVGLSLSNTETAMVGASALTDGFDAIVPSSAEGIALQPDSRIPAQDGHLMAGTGAVAAEAANRGGYVNVYATYPGNAVTAGYPLLIVQHWN
ncbi:MULTISPECIES: hypothetical protein [unclassified Nocardia]|uniref:hypothetical protein n=1 Tax=unclassified Nocardia TaxID=2637762 RepID=UPI001CE492BC|nr:MULTISPECIES: hypothetical protein [unclassified Nocardia]